MPDDSTVYCPSCGAPCSPSDEFCVKCGARQDVSGPRGKWVRKSAILAVFIIVIIIAATLFGTGSIQRIISGGNLLTQPQATSTVTSPSTSQVTAETSNLASSLASTSTPTVPPAYHMPPSVFLTAPPMPKAVGCYHYTQTGWENVGCERRHVATSSPTDVDNSKSALDINSNPTMNGGLSPSQPDQYQGNSNGEFWGINSNAPTVLTYSVLMVNIQQYEGEHDSNCGDGSYALELNTNYFTGNNGHQDWVQFTYQDYPINGELSSCPGNAWAGGGHNSGLCISEINVDTNDYSQTWCSISAEHPLRSPYEAIIEGYVNAYNNGYLSMYAFVDGDYIGLTVPDVYGLGLEGNWLQSTGGIMGEGGGSQASWSPGTILQTDIGVASCPTSDHAQLFLDCPGAPISATLGTGGTGESSTLSQAYPLLTNYYRGTHWWLSSVSNSNCGPIAEPSSLGCPDHIVNYGAAFGIGKAMTFTVGDHPKWGAVTAGGMVSTQVNVTSVDGVDAGPITMSVDGLNQGGGLGTEDLSVHPCSFSAENTIVQPGVSCTLPMDVSTNPAATPGIYHLTIKGTPPPNVPDSLPVSGFAVSGGGIASENTADYELMIEVAAAPTPVIYSPSDWASFLVNQPVPLIGYATISAPGQLGGSYVSCDQLQFQAPGQAPVTPVPDPSMYQTNGWCDAQMTFAATGPVTITLSAINAQGAAGPPAEVTISIGSAPPGKIGLGATAYAFQLSAAPPSAGVMLGGSPVQFTVNIICTNGCSSPQPVTLSLSGLPNQAESSWSTNTATPDLQTLTASVTLTITAPTGTPPGTYTVVITGTGGGYTAPPCSVQLTVETPLG